MAKEMNMEALQATLNFLDKKGKVAFEKLEDAGSLDPKLKMFSDLISDEKFCEEFFTTDSEQEAQELFRRNGLELTVEEVRAVAAYLVSIAKLLIENGGELSEDELENISGGSLADVLWYTKTPEEIVGGLTGIFGGVYSATLVGGGIGSAICPGFGTGVGVAIGFVVGAVGGFIGGKNLGKTVGKWIRSWF